MVPWHLRPSSAEAPRNAGLARRPPNRQPRVITLSLGGAATAIAVGRIGLEIGLIRSAPKPPRPPLWERAWTGLTQMRWFVEPLVTGISDALAVRRPIGRLCRRTMVPEIPGG